MQTISNRQDRSLIIILSIFIALVIIATIVKSQLIKNNNIYVIGRFAYSSDEGSETGWVHHFNYTYQNNKFSTSFGAPIGKHFIIDSFMYIKISAKYPTLSEPVTDVWVQKCIKEGTQPLNGWRKIPVCSE